MAKNPQEDAANTKSLVSGLNKSLTAYIKIASDYVNNAGDEKEQQNRVKMLLSHINKSELEMLGPKTATGVALAADDGGGCPNCPPGFQCTDGQTCTPIGGGD